MNQLMTKKDFKGIKDTFVANTSEEQFNKEASFALQLINKSNQLQKCTTESKIEAVLNISQIGLSLNPALKMAYLVPRYVNRQMVACLEPSYQGLIKLITDTGSASSVIAHVVYDCDVFEFELGMNSKVVHKPNIFETKKKAIGVYAIATLHTGEKQVEVMNIEQIKDIMSKSESYKAYDAGKIKSCVWIDHFGEMARKTILRRIVKYLPKTDNWTKLANAINLDEQDFQPSAGELHRAEEMVRTSSLSMEYQEQYYSELKYCDTTRCYEIMNELKEYQVDPISAGNSYSQTDIKNKQNLNR